MTYCQADDEGGKVKMSFLIVYDRPTAHLQRLEPFSSRLDAMRARFAAEAEAPDAEVIVVTADSEASVRRSHSRYFLQGA